VLRHELIEFGAILRHAQSLKKFAEFTAPLLEMPQCVGAALIKSAIATRAHSPSAPAFAATALFCAAIALDAARSGLECALVVHIACVHSRLDKRESPDP
jgi:hypothetical protein